MNMAKHSQESQLFCEQIRLKYLEKSIHLKYIYKVSLEISLYIMPMLILKVLSLYLTSLSTLTVPSNINLLGIYILIEYCFNNINQSY